MGNAAAFLGRFPFASPSASGMSAATASNQIVKMAERKGFEPSIRLLTVYSLSRRAPSTTRPPLRGALNRGGLRLSSAGESIASSLRELVKTGVAKRGREMAIWRHIPAVGSKIRAKPGAHWHQWIDSYAVYRLALVQWYICNNWLESGSNRAKLGQYELRVKIGLVWSGHSRGDS